MGFDASVAQYESHVGEVFVVKHPKQVSRELRLGHLDADGQHPDVVKGQLAVVAAEDVQLSLDDVGCVSAAGPWFELGRGDLLPVVGVYVKHVHIVHPMDTVVAAEVDYFRVYQTPCGGDSSRRLITGDDRLHPCKGLRVQIEDVVQLSQLVGLSAEDVYLLVEGNGRVLKPADGCGTLCGHGPAPLETEQVENQQVVQPELAIAATKDKHLVVDDAGGVELAHGCLAADDGRYVEAEFVDALLQVYKNHVRQHLEAIPATVDYYLATVPNLGTVAHARLRKFVLVYFWLEPGVLLGVKDEDIVDDALLTVALAATEYYQVLTKLR